MWKLVFPAVVIVTVLIVVYLTYRVILRVKHQRNIETKNDETLSTNDEEADDLSCKFVLDAKGNKIGESVTVDRDVLIIKKKSKYLGVPLKHVEKTDKTLTVKGLIDEKKAEILGEKWRRRSYNKIKQPQEERELR